MFILHSSNKTENLLEHLLAVLESAPLPSPFAKEFFLIQSQGMERWLSQQLAERLGVWGNYAFLFPGAFFNRLCGQLGVKPDVEAFNREVMLWRFESLLRELDDPAFAVLAGYLSGGNRTLKRYQLARQLAQLFDQYQIMRPDMLDAWQAGKKLYGTGTEHWQSLLWQKILRQAGATHRGTLWQEAIDQLNAGDKQAATDKLPERVCVFGVNTMPPVFLSFLQSLSRHCQLHFFLLNPAQTYWADLPGKKQRLALADDCGHPLLSALGQQGREFQELLLEQARFELEYDSFEAGAHPANALSNLEQLQNDILNNKPGGQALAADGSIGIHACHSRLREVEVLKDQLLNALQQDPGLQLREIVVMAPDIEQYAPYISAVFDGIQHAVADRSLRLSNPALDAFINFLEVCQSRFGWLVVFDLLARDTVFPGFGLSETDLELIKHWLMATQVRWGQSAEHRGELGLPEESGNTWQMALERLMMGVAIGEEEDFADGVLPFAAIEGGSADALGGLWDFMQLLFNAGAQCRRGKPLKAWADQLYQYAGQLLAAASAADLQELNELLAELGGALADVHSGEVELPVIIAWLKSSVSERKSSTGFLRGQLTFCSLLPMRSIPFKVIALLGLNDGEFPKLDRSPVFDLLAQHYRKGDRSRRADDRYQFLEVLLSARKQLLIFYQGQSLSHNQPIPPSVVVNELLEILENHYGITRLVSQHPMQAFSARYFSGESGLFSYSEANCAIAEALRQRDVQLLPSTPWWQGRIEAGPETASVLEVGELFEFFRHPQRYFMQRQLDLRMQGVDAEVEEREPFDLSMVDSYRVFQDWLECELTGKHLSLAKLQAQGRWLQGVSGELEYNRQQARIKDFAGRLKAKGLGEPLPGQAVDLLVGPYRLIGKLSHLHANGSLFYRFATLKGKDWLIAWLHHVIINRIQPQNTYLVGIDADLVLRPEHGGKDDLVGFLDIYREGLSRPDAFFTEPAFAYAQQALKLKQSARAKVLPLEQAVKQLETELSQPHQLELRRLFLENYSPEALLDARFEAVCQQLLVPPWEAVNS
ncbi:MAG: exodeoxyribonuclease V subunit gamma [Methylobacter sp.]|nr:MAG: exodeoxyribonuclease V subunit gamma [Methylobacter sp.]